ncbi:FG-GAP repeat domain-containing protein [Neolewinella maritima]|uniref:FG-GAP repeat domain-containing protein n=1 Tax=Neolewinella maritima TaxID=1383882 RepID=UPI001EE7ABE4|nr:VCBS repeat-containing protein [Neolewinella maritima]
MRHLLITLFFGGVLLLCYCSSPEPTTADRYTAVCGSCHLPPDPRELPKSVWSESVLPEMASRMGLQTYAYDPLAVIGEQEYTLAHAGGHYPDAPTISYEVWEDVKAYILAQAPDSLPLVPVPALAQLPSFTARTVATEHKPGALVTYLDVSPQGVRVGDGYGSLYTIDTGGAVRDTLVQGRRPITHYAAAVGGDLVLEIGNMYPTEDHNGALYRMGPDGRTVVADSLHRPVHLLVEDLDRDGRQEIVVSEYGNYTGALTLLQPDGAGAYERQRLSGSAGTIRVVARDMNADGRTDLVSMHAQGDEGIDVFYQSADGRFTRELLLQFSPVWGSSWFELVDFDGDGDEDILTAHGDNADYSNIRKPYHGIRLYENDGANTFTLRYFYPLPGATRVVARDFDADGDMDLAVACNFADFARAPDAGFVYLEQTGGSDSLSFTARTTPAALDGRWLVLEAGDYDGDGDEDLALGSFTLNPAPVPPGVAERWRRDSVDVLLLTNTLR